MDTGTDWDAQTINEYNTSPTDGDEFHNYGEADSDSLPPPITETASQIEASMDESYGARSGHYNLRLR